MSAGMMRKKTMSKTEYKSTKYIVDTNVLFDYSEVYLCKNLDHIEPDSNKGRRIEMARELIDTNENDFVVPPIVWSEFAGAWLNKKNACVMAKIYLLFRNTC